MFEKNPPQTLDSLALMESSNSFVTFFSKLPFFFLFYTDQRCERQDDDRNCFWGRQLWHWTKSQVGGLWVCVCVFSDVICLLFAIICFPPNIKFSLCFCAFDCRQATTFKFCIFFFSVQKVENNKMKSDDCWLPALLWPLTLELFFAKLRIALYLNFLGCASRCFIFSHSGCASS